MLGSRINAKARGVLDSQATLKSDARKCGRANGKERMARPRYQDGSLFIRGKRTKVWVARWREDVIREDGTLHRTRPTVVLGGRRVRNPPKRLGCNGAPESRRNPLRSRRGEVKPTPVRHLAILLGHAGPLRNVA
jgi:hypothetical protein